MSGVSVEAMAPREVIGRAIALLQGHHGVTESAAFEMLVRGPSDSHQAVLDAAADVVRQASEA